MAYGSPEYKRGLRQAKWIGIVLLVVIAGIGFLIWQAFFTLKASDKPLKTTHDLTMGCSAARKYFPTAAAYTSGGGPHPIVIFRSGAESSDQVSQVRASGLDGPYEVRNPEQAQLIACLGDGSNGARVGECKFSGGDSLPLYAGEYDAVLYEAKTGEQVAEAHLTGSMDKDDCPYMFMSKGNPDLHTAPDAKEIQRAFGRYVESGS